MKELDIGSLPVCDDGHLAGVITDRDITIRAVAKGSDPATVTVREVMTPEVLWCFEDDEVEEAARIMRENQVRRILVLNEANELVGITSLGELATITGDRLLAGETLESVSEESRGVTEEGLVEEDADDDGDSTAEARGELSRETRVTGLLHDREAAKKVVTELKSAGFTDSSVLIAMQDESAQKTFIRETLARAISEEEMPSLPDLSSGQILIMIEAEERAAGHRRSSYPSAPHALTGSRWIYNESRWRYLSLSQMMALYLL
jgi:predicted transcriptional regulator